LYYFSDYSIIYLNIDILGTEDKMMKNILKTIVIILILMIPICVNAQTDLYAQCEVSIFNAISYYKLSSVTAVHGLTVRWSDTDKSVTTTYNGKNLVFNTVTDIVYIGSEKAYFGDIVLYNGYTYITKETAAVFGSDYSEYLLTNNIEYMYIGGTINKVVTAVDSKLTVTKLGSFDFNGTASFCINEFADLFGAAITRNENNDYIVLSSGEHEIYFYPQTDYICLDGTYFTAGDIIISESRFYAPNSVLTYFIDIFMPKAVKAAEPPVQPAETPVKSDFKYNTYTMNSNGKKYISINEICTANNFYFKWSYVHKNVEVMINTKTYYILTLTNIVMDGDIIYREFDVVEENDVIYVEEGVLRVFGLVETPVEVAPAPTTTPTPATTPTPTTTPVAATLPEGFVPIRTFAEYVKGTIAWNDTTYCATITLAGNKYVFDTRNKKLYFNNIEVTGYEFYFENGFTYVNTSLLTLFESDVILTAKDGSYDVIIIKGNNISLKTSYLLEKPDRLVIDVKNTDITVSGSITGLNYSSIRVLTGENGIDRVVVDLSYLCTYAAGAKNGYVEVRVKKSSATGAANNIATETAAAPANNSSDIDLAETINRTYATAASSDDKVNLSVKNYNGYIVTRISDPNRIVLYIPGGGVESGDTSMTSINSKYIQNIELYENSTGLIIAITTNIQCRYEIVEHINEGLTIEIYTQKIINMNYYNSSDRKYINLSGLELADQYGNLKSNVTVETVGLVTTLKFYDITYKLTAGILYVNDEYIERIQVTRSDAYVIMTIYAKNEYIYYLNSAKSNYTHINILPKLESTDKIVVIDAGHGGYDPGAVVNNIYESSINLAVAIKVEELLKKEGISVYMMRSTDEYVGLYERAYVANIINASIFVSIHSNSISNSSFKGIMTLVYPSSESVALTGKELGRTIQKSILSTTGAIDRNVIDRPNLVVLNSTMIPAALVECGFMTNSEELSNLLNNDYQQKLAEGIAKGIIEAISMD